MCFLREKGYNTLLILGCGLIFCSRSQAACRPGTADYPMQPAGKQPPSISEIKQSLVGMTVKGADRFLGGAAKVTRQANNGSERRIWMFEKIGKSVQKNCTSPDVVKYNQAVLVINAEMKDQRAVTCKIDVRVSLSTKIRSVKDIFESPAGPLDTDLGSCASH